MDIGLVYFPTDTSVDPVTLGRAAEDAGFESLFVTEHTHIPTSRLTPYPAGGDLPPEYFRTWDPFVALTAVAATTRRLNVGTGICLVNQHHPINLAKSCATLQRVSGGRFILGVGPGWNVDEMANHGVDPDTRFAAMRERIQAMRALWTDEIAEYHGDHVDFDPVWQWPKPEPAIPVLLSGWGPTVLQRVVDYADGWFPIGGRGTALADRITELADRCAAAGRDPIAVTIYQPGPKPEQLAEYRDLGVARVLCALPAEAPEATLARVERYAGLLDG
ncbi:MAG TPA: LLM class F420-dependent oxidoreductase [Euzebya sp.]|nr:LLM class F420-dependent oxidoreductase [Euzebya sp.]